MTVLYGRAGDGLALADVIALAEPCGATALLAAPDRYQVADVRDGACRGPDGPCAMDEVFEARVFSGDLELRWLHAGSGRGRAVALSEEEDSLPGELGDPLPALEAVRTFDQRYLLWGTTVEPAADGWATLFSARVGLLSVPLASFSRERDRKVRLRAREYVAVEPAYGNAYVAEERLLGLEEVAR